MLVVDEAQHLDADLLEELRLLAIWRRRTVGRCRSCWSLIRRLRRRWRRPELTALRQRLAVRAELGPLSLEESADYLLHHLRAAGARPEEVFADEAVELLARGAGGVPRLLNQAAHKALTLAVSAEVETVDVEAALEALAVARSGGGGAGRRGGRAGVRGNVPADRRGRPRPWSEDEAVATSGTKERRNGEIPGDVAAGAAPPARRRAVRPTAAAPPMPASKTKRGRKKSLSSRSAPTRA